MNCLYCDNCQNHVQVLTMESIFSESAPQIKALDRNLSAFSTLFARGKSWDNVRSTAAPYTESRLARLVRNKSVGFPIVEQYDSGCNQHYSLRRKELPRTFKNLLVFQTYQNIFCINAYVQEKTYPRELTLFLAYLSELETILDTYVLSQCGFHKENK